MNIFDIIALILLGWIILGSVAICGIITIFNDTFLFNK